MTETETKVVWTIWFDDSGKVGKWKMRRYEPAICRATTSQEDSPQAAMAFVEGAVWSQTSDTSWTATTFGGPTAEECATPTVTMALLGGKA